VGTVFYHESNYFSVMSWWESSLRLLEYDGIDIDALWGDLLPRRGASPRRG